MITLTKITACISLLLMSMGYGFGQDERKLAASAKSKSVTDTITEAESGESVALPNAGKVQVELKQWVLTRQLIARENSNWQSEQETLSDLNEVRQREIGQLKEFSEAAGKRIDEIDKQRKKIVAEESELKVWRRSLKSQVTLLESELRPLISLFPVPLRAKVEESLARIEEPDAERPLQNRMRDVLLVMQEYLNFHNTITLDADIRAIDGEDREIEVLYMGLTQAWYVDQTGQYSGYGVPGSDGWVWTEAPALATAVRQAIAIQSRQATPAFVRLPISNTSNSDSVTEGK